jgi:putative ABC transport system permease protein
VLADSLDRVGVAEVTATARDVDLSVAPGDDTGQFAENDLDAIAATGGVGTVIPRAEVTVRGTDADGRIDEGIWLGVTAVPADDVAAGVTMAEGRLPREPDEAVLDVISAERAGVETGATYTVAPWDTDPMTFTVVGIVEPSTAGGPVLGTAFDTVSELGGVVTRVDVVLVDGADAAATATALEQATGGTVETGAELTDRLLTNSASLANALRLPLLILGAVALVVAAFVIANTFRILVAQRTRDLALLRTVGATRKQVRRGILAESLVVGLLGSVVGLAVGIGGGSIAGRLLTTGTDLPLAVSPTTVAWALAIGVVVTVGAAWVPARAATRVPPLAALRIAPDGNEDARTGRVRTAVGVLMIAGGAGLLVFAALLAATLGSLALVAVVFGATVFGIGVLVLGPVIMPPLVVLGSRLARLVVGRRRRAALDLATANVLRNPRRVAVTSGALLIGVTVVVGFAIMASSARSAANTWVDDNVPADITVSLAGSGDEGASISDDVVAAVDGTPGVRVAVPIRSTFAEAPGISDGFVDVNGIDLDRFATLTDTELVLPDAGEALLDEQTAVRHDIEAGDAFTFDDDRGATHEVTVVAVSSRAGSGLTVPLDEFEAVFPDAGISTIAVDAADDADVESVRTAIVDRTAGHTDIAVRNADDVRDDAMAQFDRAIGVALAVLGLAVVIAVIGIGNTMSLAVHERTQEIGLLRALGLTRRQTRAMLSAEAVVISTIAGVLGVVISIGFSAAAVRTLPGLTLTVPWLAVAGAVVVAGLLGWLASVIPARRAARTSPVVALAS